MSERLRLHRGAAEDRLVSSAGVSAFLDAAERKGLELHSFMIVRHGKVAAEGWWAPYKPEHPHMLFSLSKSFTSTAIGIAVREGLLAVNDKVASFFPEEAPRTPSVYQAGLEVRHLLSMSTGHAKDSLEWMRQGEPENWVRDFLHAPVDYEPGTHFVYNNGASYLLSAIVQKASGETLLDYLRPRLFEPLGIAEAAWDTCPRGICYGGWGLSLTTESIAKFGQLYLQNGMWHGERLVPEEWVRAATVKQVSNGEGDESDWKQGYGYQFWRCRYGAYRGDGMFGQFCIVLPGQDTVIAITGANTDMQAVLDEVWTHLLPALDGNLAASADEAADVRNRLASLTLPRPQTSAVPGSTRASEVAGKRYAFDERVEDIEAVRFRFADRETAVVYRTRDGESEIVCGSGEWIYSHTMLEGRPRLVAASCVWEAPDRLTVDVCYVETPFRLHATFRFGDDEIEMALERNVGGRTPAGRRVTVGRAESR